MNIQLVPPTESCRESFLRALREFRDTASIRVIEKNGGSLRGTKALDTRSPLKRYYWITV